MITHDEIEAIARRVVELQREQAKPVVVDADPWFTRKQAEQYLNVSRKTFWFMRQEHKALAPCSEKPLRWSKRNLDGWKLAQSLPPSIRRKVA